MPSASMKSASAMKSALMQYKCHILELFMHLDTLHVQFARSRHFHRSRPAADAPDARIRRGRRHGRPRSGRNLGPFYREPRNLGADDAGLSSQKRGENCHRRC